MIVVATDCRSRIERLGCSADDRDVKDVARAIEQQIPSVRRPVGGFDAPFGDVSHSPVSGSNRKDLKRAKKDRPRIGVGEVCRQLDVGKHGSLRNVSLVRADTQADIERILERQSPGPCGQVRRLALFGQEHVDVLAPFFNPQSLGRGDVRLNFARGRTFFGAILKRRQPIAMQRHIRIGRICVEALADQQASFAVRILPDAAERDFSLKSNVARYSLPYEMKCVGCKPHVLAAAADRVGLVGRLNIELAGPITAPTSPCPSKMPNGPGGASLATAMERLRRANG